MTPVFPAGNTCGLPKINNVMKNLTLNEGDTARYVVLSFVNKIKSQKLM